MPLIFILFQNFLGIYDRDLTNEEIEKCKSDTVVMEDGDCFIQMFENLKNTKAN